MWCQKIILQKTQTTNLLKNTKSAGDRDQFLVLKEILSIVLGNKTIRYKIKCKCKNYWKPLQAENPPDIMLPRLTQKWILTHLSHPQRRDHHFTAVQWGNWIGAHPPPPLFGTETMEFRYNSVTPQWHQSVWQSHSSAQRSNVPAQLGRFWGTLSY